MRLTALGNPSAIRIARSVDDVGAWRNLAGGHREEGYYNCKKRPIADKSLRHRTYCICLNSHGLISFK
jgi:hypothetical protein